MRPSVAPVTPGASVLLLEVSPLAVVFGTAAYGYAATALTYVTPGVAAASDGRFWLAPEVSIILP